MLRDLGPPTPNPEYYNRPQNGGGFVPPSSGPPSRPYGPAVGDVIGEPFSPTISKEAAKLGQPSGLQYQWVATPGGGKVLQAVGDHSRNIFQVQGRAGTPEYEASWKKARAASDALANPDLSKLKLALMVGGGMLGALALPGAAGGGWLSGFSTGGGGAAGGGGGAAAGGGGVAGPVGSAGIESVGPAAGVPKGLLGGQNKLTAVLSGMGKNYAKNQGQAAIRQALAGSPPQQQLPPSLTREQLILLLALLGRYGAQPSRG